MPRDPRDPSRCRDARQRRGMRLIERPRAADIDIEAVQGRGGMNVERLFQRPEHLGDRPGGIDRARHRGRQHRAAVDRHQRMRAQRRKADFDDLLGALARMQHRAAAAFAMGIDQVVDRRIDLRVMQRLHHQIAFPGAVMRLRPMLDRAAAADPEMRTERRHAVGRGDHHPQQVPAVGMTRHGVGIDGLARQRIGHEDRPIRRRRYAIAAMSDIRNDKPVHHAGVMPGFCQAEGKAALRRSGPGAIERRTMNLFVIAAGLMAVAHVVAALQRPRLAVIVSGILWALYAYYEHLIATGVLCDANCNIRVDLVLFFPILGLATFWAYQSYMGRPSHAEGHRHGSGRHRPGCFGAGAWPTSVTAICRYAVILGGLAIVSSTRSNRGLRPVGRDEASGLHCSGQCGIACGTSGM